MKRTTLLLFFFIFIKSASFSCLNTYHALDKDGHFHDFGMEKFVGFNMNFNPRLMRPKFPKMEQEIREQKSPYLLSDYAVLLLKAGKTQEALELLINLNQNLPNEYKIAANLGTAYELNGNLDSALHYIKRGVELNPNAHEGSEWVHIRILETKLGLLDNPNLLKNRTVLQLTEEELKENAIREQLEIQIRERFPFSPKGNDPIMASLMIDLGDCYMETGTFEHAKAFYTIAQEYYGTPESAVKDKIQQTLELRSKYKHVTVPDLNEEGMEIKIEGVSYLSILDDNNTPPFQLDWSKINTDVPTLLAMVDLEMTVETDSIQQVQAEVKEENIAPVSSVKTKEEGNQWIWLILVTVSALSALTFLLFRKRPGRA